MAKSKNIDTKGNIFFFFIFTLIFTIVKHITGGKGGLLWLIIYVALVFITQYYINLRLSKNLCGQEQYQSTFYNTFLPWFLIFGMLIVLLNSFPGWVRPFSNTFGYMAAQLGGIDSVSRRIFKTSVEFESTKSDTSDKPILENLENIYNNPGQMVNEIPLEFYSERNETGKMESKWDFWEKMNQSKLIKPEVYADENNILKNKLISLVRVKDNIGYFFWYLLTGILAIVVSENFILGASCEKSLDELQAEYDEYQTEKTSNAGSNKEYNKSGGVDN